MDDRLFFREDGSFTIVQFTDVHWTDGCEEDLKTGRLMRLVLERENPDLVVFTGDTSVGGDNLTALGKALEPVREAGIPFAVVFGNHDDEDGESKQALLAVQKEFGNCLTEAGDSSLSGLGNYILTVGSRKENGAGWNLYMLDSLTYNENKEVGGYGYFKEDQIRWYRNNAARIRKEAGDIPALAFFHIPLPEYNEVWNTQPCFGEKNEDVCCPRQNSGMFSAMLEMGDVKAAFVGHDHINDYYGNLLGIGLYYGRATGYNTYGRENYPRGARVLRLTEGRRDFETWLRLDDGSVVVNQAEHQPERPR